MEYGRQPSVAGMRESAGKENIMTKNRQNTKKDRN